MKKQTKVEKKYIYIEARCNARAKKKIIKL